VTTTGPTPAADASARRPAIDPDRGLTSADVAERIADGRVNDLPEAPSRTVGQIFRANLLTRFNFLMVGLAVVPLALREPRDALFLLVVVANAFIGTAQELRAKRTLDQLSLLSAPKAIVVRDGAAGELAISQLVLDDVIELRPGAEVPADAIVARSDGLELDESLLTGESDSVVKEVGEEVLSGSFVAAGNGRAQVAKVGSDAYAAKLAEQARRFTLVRSELMATINRIIQIVTWVLVPVAVLQFVSSVYWSDASLKEGLLGAVASVVGMVPEGLVLLTSVAFAVGVVRLAQHRTLVQELPAIEVLARVDTVCVDKTGTITEGALDLTGLEALDGSPAASDSARTERSERAERALAAIAAAEPDPNATMLAVREHSDGHAPGWTSTGRIPFSSARKWSAYSFAGEGSWVVGAPEFVLDDELPAVRAAVDRHAAAGRRVLLLARSDTPLDGDELPRPLEPVSLVLFEDRIRADAPETLAYFAGQGVQLKVISGDNPTTVGAVAQRAGLGSTAQPVDARGLPTETGELAEVLAGHDVFGRVTPVQKQSMVVALQADDHVVAMTGDGVNDVLALKESDCGIAMASGSEATRAVAQLVLLDSNFSALPRVVAEGRRVINNIERVATLFLTKTTYASIVAILTGVLTVPYPFLPRHLTLISGLTIGIPAFFLALAPNDELVRPGFLARVARVALPGGLLVTVATMVSYSLARADHQTTLAQDRTSAVIAAGGVAFLVLLQVARPLNPLRLTLVATMVGAFVLAFLIPFVSDFFALETGTLRDTVISLAVVAGAWPVLLLGDRVGTRAQQALANRAASRAA
jgi:cation-transporting ATPase E